MIRALDIRRGERPLNGLRLGIHMAHATAPEATLVRTKPRRRLWRYVAMAYLAMPAAAIAAGVALWILRRMV